MAVRSQAKLREILTGVGKAIAASAPENDVLATFARQLFAGGSYDDLAPFSPGELADIAGEALEFLARRQRGRSKIRVVNGPDQANTDRRPFTLIEIANDDMPFLVESVLSELAERGIEVHLLLHPVLWVNRDAKGNLEAIPDDDARVAADAVRESFIHLHVDRIAAGPGCAELEERLTTILRDVRTVVLDWRSMRARLEKAISVYQTSPPPVPVAELAETIEFLEWLVQDHFTFLGMREFTYDDTGGTSSLSVIDGSGLGVLRDPTVRVLRLGTELVTMTPEVREFLMQPAPLIVTKANVKAQVHRRAHMDYVAVKQFDESGAVKGELRIVGLFTSAAYTRSARNIPFLRRKVELVLSMAGFDPTTHSGRALVNVLESYPRDELFQIDIDTLVETALGILQLAERPRTRIFVRYDKFDRFVSVLVYVPRDSYDSDVRRRIGEHLTRVFEGRVSAYYPAYPEGTLARVHFIIGHDGGGIPRADAGELERDIAAIARGWSENLKSALEAAHKPAEAHALYDLYRSAFSTAYQDIYDPSVAIADIAKIDGLTAESALALDLAPQGREDDEDRDGVPDLHLKLYHLNEPIALSDRVPVLENMGFRAIDERTFEIERGGHDEPMRVFLHDIVLEADDGEAVDASEIDTLIEEGYLAVWNGEAENDGYNRLIRHTRLGWRDVSVLRAVGKYLQQAGIPFSQDYMAETLTRHYEIAGHIVELFHVRFDPDSGLTNGAREKRAEEIAANIETALESVSVLDEDRIIRRFVNVIDAALRTNFYQRDEDGGLRPAISVKLRSSEVEGLPAPRPFAEIFVYSPRVEGVHLRGGPIARGGLRWSDRPQDFRTEVLGLAKAQQVKNAVIVPVGAKGGFVPKWLPRDGSRDAVIAEAIACYKIFVSSLLDVTDNLVGDELVPPADVVRHDGDDPYLVVAADKGTATFSDIANEISTGRGYWLGDAFASGGSAGYDHKKIGITARGAWEAVKRHFREIDRNIQSEPFTVIGVGDMSGDVFGNGMLLSKKIRLVAAFDHRDIFIDPDPDPAASFAERRRLFRLDRSSWRDYKPELISRGGGVFSRQDKSIRLTREIKELTGLTADRVTPAELMHALLASPTDLLWFGGIGTYVRASDESDAEVGDRANDAIRITAAQLQASVIGEGANLGVTQRARVEFAAAGGRLNTDAIDNSAGVNCSDVEVNIKIALANAIKGGALKRADRDKLLADMTDEVARVVLRNNYEQTLCLGLAVSRGVEDLNYQTRLMKHLESRGVLDRALEYLPDDATLAEREQQGEGLTRPELAVLLAYGKITLFTDILATDVPDDAYLARELIAYFPIQMRERFVEAIESHRLRREIIATMLANSIINRGGSTMIQRLRDETGSDVAEIVFAFTLARDAYDIEAILDDIDALDNKIASAVQTTLYTEVQDLIRRQTVWFLRHMRVDEGLESAVARFHQGVERVARTFDTLVPDEAREQARERTTELVELGIPKKLARRIAILPMLQRAGDIVVVADTTGRDIDEVARVFFALGGTLGIDWLLDRAHSTPVPGFYDRLALNRVVDSISAAQRRLTTEALSVAKDGDLLAPWLESHARPIERARSAVADLADSGAVTLSKLSVASAYMHDLAEG